MSDLKLERMLLGEIPPEETDQVRLDALRRENQEILEAHPPAQVVAEIERRRRRAEKRRGLRIAAPALAAAMAAALIVLALPPQETERPKGAVPYLVIDRRAGDHADRLTSGATVESGDLLQISYVALGRPYGVIFSIDGRGVVTLHHPSSPKGPASLESPDHPVPLPTAYELDDAPSFERFFFVASPAALDVDRVLETARAFAAD